MVSILSNTVGTRPMGGPSLRDLLHMEAEDHAALAEALEGGRDSGAFEEEDSGWQAEMQIPMPDVIQRGDQVTVFCQQTQERDTLKYQLHHRMREQPRDSRRFPQRPHPSFASQMPPSPKGEGWGCAASHVTAKGFPFREGPRTCSQPQHSKQGFP